MNIICVSRGSRTHGREFAEALAAKLGYRCIGREELFEEAVKRRIPVGKLETSVVMRREPSEALSRELEHYKALAASMLCEKAQQENIVYHGRTGHLLLPGVDHILKIRVVLDLESRINLVSEKLKLSHRKAQQYIESIEDDRRSWVRRFYNVEWDVFTLYDMVLNLSEIGVGNAAQAACAMAQLPEFQPTPASERALEDLLVGSRCRLRLAEDERTRKLSVRVRAGAGTVHVTHPHGAKKGVADIPLVLGAVEGVRKVVCTAAETSILWIQEAFDPEGASYRSVMEIAAAWDAAVELIRFTPGDGDFDDESSDLSRLYARLIGDGKAGRKRALAGSRKTLLNAIDRDTSYRLIVLDGIFLDKGESTRKRLLTEWSNAITETVKVPVLSIEQIVSRYRFGVRQAVGMVACGLVAAASVWAVFHFQEPILGFLGREGMKWRILATAGVALFVPFFAQMYGTFTHSLLKLFKFD